MAQFASSSNMTWDNTPVGYWSVIEVHTGIVFACLPAIRSLQYRFFPKPSPADTAYSYDYKDQTVQSVARHASTRKMLDNGFSRMDEEYQLESGVSQMQMNGHGIGRAGTFTEIERCDMYMEDDAQLLRGHEIPRLALTSATPRSGRSTPGGKTGGAGAPWEQQGIQVMKGYSVTVENSPPSELPPVFYRSGERKGSARSGAWV
jgi:hypothetical protein